MADTPATRASLLLRLRDVHDAAAWREFLDLYAPLVYGYARKKGLQDADASDLSQEVFHAVAQAIGRLNYDVGRGRFRNWLFTIVRRKLANRRMAERQRTPRSGDSATEFLLNHCAAAEDSDAEWEAEWQQYAFARACAQVRNAVKEPTWQAFWRTAVDGQSCKEVARDLGLSVGAVYHARSRILEQLRQQIDSMQEP